VQRVSALTILNPKRKEITMSEQQQDPTHKGRQPDWDVMQVMPSGRGTRLINIGAFWDAPNGNASGDTVYGRFVLKRREKLEEMREQNEQSQGQMQQQALDVDNAPDI
tara:strand:- start:494 stop:817 length:324 start_codon:yes stop_codon:yes gene_type:complete